VNISDNNIERDIHRYLQTLLVMLQSLSTTLG